MPQRGLRSGPNVATMVHTMTTQQTEGIEGLWNLNGTMATASIWPVTAWTLMNQKRHFSTLSDSLRRHITQAPRGGGQPSVEQKLADLSSWSSYDVGPHCGSYQHATQHLERNHDFNAAEASSYV